MTTAPVRSRNVRLAGAAVGLLVLVLFLYRVRDTLPPFLIAYAAACLLDPLLDRMQRRGWSRRAATLLVFMVFLLVFAGVALVLIPAAVQQAAEFVGNIPTYYDELSKRLQATLLAKQALLDRFNLPTSSSEVITRYQGQITGMLQTLLSRLLQFFAGSVSKLAWLAIIPIVTFYLLLEIDPLRARIVHLVPSAHRSRFLGLAEQVGAVFSGYVRGLIIVCAGYAVVTMLVLALGFRLSYSLMIGLVAGVLYAVPYIGALSTIAIGGLVAFSTNHSGGYALGVMAALLAINQVFDQVITPRIVGGLVGLSPVVSIFALTAGGELFGLPGMILAVPVAASIKVLLQALWPQVFAPLPDPDAEHGADEGIRASEGELAGATKELQPTGERDGEGKLCLPADELSLSVSPPGPGSQHHPPAVRDDAVPPPAVPSLPARAVPAGATQEQIADGLPPPQPPARRKR